MPILYSSANRDARKVTTDIHLRYYGTELNNQSLTPGANDDEYFPTTMR